MTCYHKAQSMPALILLTYFQGRMTILYVNRLQYEFYNNIYVSEVHSFGISVELTKF